MDAAVEAAPIEAAIATAAAAAYAEDMLIAPTPAVAATALALTLNTAAAAIALGATQAQIDAAVVTLTADNAASNLLANILALDAANTAVVDFLAAVDTTVVDPTTVNDDEDADAATDDTVASSGDVHTAYATANTTLSGLVTGTADYSADSATTKAALYAAELASLNAAVVTAQAAVTDAEAAIAAVTGLGAAITTLNTATATATTANAAAAATQVTLDVALAGFDSVVANGTPRVDAFGNVSNVAVITTPGVAATTTESSVITMSAMIAGQSITIDGVTLTATAAMTATEAAVAFAAKVDGALFTVVNDGAADALTFTSKTVNTNVTDIVVSSSGSETVFPGLAALKTAAAADASADAAATIANAAVVTATAAVAAIDGDTTALSNLGAVMAAVVDAANPTAAEITTEATLRATTDTDYDSLVATYQTAVNAVAALTTTKISATDLTAAEITDQEVANNAAINTAGTLAAAIAVAAGDDAAVNGDLDGTNDFDATITNVGGVLTLVASISDAVSSGADVVLTTVDADGIATITAAGTTADGAGTFAGEIAALITTINTDVTYDALVATYQTANNAVAAVTTTKASATDLTAAEITAQEVANATAITDFADLVTALTTSASPLATILLAAQNAVFNDQGDTDATNDTGAQVDVADLIAAKADFDALVVIDTALTALETTVATVAANVNEINLAHGANTFGANTVAFISNLVAGNAATETDFDFTTDSIYFGDTYTVNTGALTTGDNSVLEMFITQGTTAADTLITFETAAFGSASAGDFFTVSLTGVATTDLTILDGMIIGA